jgi:hypothetical protein
MDFLEHAKTAVEILLSAHATALMIVNLTPTPKDDAAVAKLYRLVEILAGLLSKKVKM